MMLHKVFPNHHTLHNRLVSFWKLEEASGTRVDSVPVNSLKTALNSLTAVNTPGNTTGKIGNAATFVRASSQRLTVASTASLQGGDTDFTIALWVNPQSTTGAMRFMGKAPAGSPGSAAYEYALNSTAGPAFSFSTSGPGSIAATATWGSNFSINTWYWVLVYHDSVNNVIGIQVDNGTAVTAAFSVGVNASTAVFTLGGNVTGPNDFSSDSYIDAVGWWRRILTAEEKTYLYNSGNGREFTFA